MTKEKKLLGSKGEDLACSFIKGLGYNVIDRNFSSRLGELDIIAEKDDAVFFFEVRTRRSSAFGLPYESISKRKINTLKKVSEIYARLKKLTQKKLKLSFISVMIEKNKPEIKIYEDIIY